MQLESQALTIPLMSDAGKVLNQPEGGDGKQLRRGWTTGACATAAARAAVEALFTGAFPDPVHITLPNGARPAFALAESALGDGVATAGVVKDAGDDPDVTHGALVITRVHISPSRGSGIVFRAGTGVGTITRPGLPLPPGEPAINPVPRQMITAAIQEAANLFGGTRDIVVEISIPNGERLAEKTLNGRLGIVGGLSILGTTGIVVPYSCAAWIDTIHRGIDVARASGVRHIAGSTGATSEAAVAQLYKLPEIALIEMGDFAGGMLKYLKAHPVPRVTIAGGFAKLSKLAAGRLDLHSKRGAVDMGQLCGWLARLGAPAPLITAARQANTAMEILTIAQSASIPLGPEVARRAAEVARGVLRSGDIILDVVVVARDGTIVS